MNERDGRQKEASTEGLMGNIERIKAMVGEAQQIVAWRKPVYIGCERDHKEGVVKVTAGRNLPDEFRLGLPGKYLLSGIKIRRQGIDYLYTTPTLLFSFMRSEELETFGNFRTKLVIPGDQRIIDLEPLKKTMTGEEDEDADHLEVAYIINDWLRADAISAALRISDTLRQEKENLRLTDEAEEKLKEELKLSEEPSVEQIAEVEGQRKKLLAGAIAQAREQDEIRLSLHNLTGEEPKSKEDQRLRRSISQEFLAREKEKPGQTVIDWFLQKRKEEGEVVQVKLESSGLSLELLQELEGRSIEEVKRRVSQATEAYEKEEKKAVSLKQFLEGEEQVARVLSRVIDSLEALQGVETKTITQIVVAS